MSLANLDKMAKVSPEPIAALVGLKEAVFRDGALTAKEKTLMALALGCALKCDTCIEANAQAAIRMGATKAELNEAMLVAMYMAGPTSVVWTRKVGDLIE